MVSTPFRPAARANVFCSKLCPSASSMKGLGCASRDTGHSRAPAPPERITGTSLLTSHSLEVGFDHHGDELFQACFCLPAELGLRLGRISHQHVHFGRAIKFRV